MYDNMQYNADFHQAREYALCYFPTDRPVGDSRKASVHETGWFQDLNLAEIWEFPEMGVPPNPFIDGLSIINYKPASYWGSPIEGNRHMASRSFSMYLSVMK